MFHTDEDLLTKTFGIKKSMQRWEICLTQVNFYFPIVLQVLYNRTYGNEEIATAAKKFISSAVDEICEKFVENSKLSLLASIDALKKMRSMKIMAGFDSKMLKIKNIDDYYEELELVGDEGFLKISIEAKKFRKKVFLQKSKNVMKILFNLAKNHETQYDVENGNILREFFSSKFNI
jgi:stress-induced morphogen